NLSFQEQFMTGHIQVTISRSQTAKQSCATERKSYQAKEPPIKTNFLELIQELCELTTDDSLVVAAVASIFGYYRVRLSQSQVPVRLSGTGITIRARRKSALGK